MKDNGGGLLTCGGDCVQAALLLFIQGDGEFYRHATILSSNLPVANLSRFPYTPRFPGSLEQSWPSILS